MIQSVSQIEKEFLIKTIVQNEQPVRFHGVSTIGTGLITKIDRSSMSVDILNTFDDTPFCLFEHITGYFDCHGSKYAFDTTVRNCNQNRILIDPPVKLLKSLQRKFVRVRKPRGVEILFHLANEDIILDYPVCPEYISVEANERTAQNAGEKIPDLVNAFKNQLADKCSNSTIIMFRTKKPELFEEELISKTGKVLFIPSTGALLPKNDPYPEGRIITQGIEESFEDPNYFIEGSKFEKLLVEKKTQAISSEIWCPIVYYQYVVGYINVVNMGAESFDISMVDYLWDFSRLLALKLKESGYFSLATDTIEPRRHRAGILDISPGGMFISLPKTEIRTPIREGSIFAIEIQFATKNINCSARITRRYDENDSTLYGMSFTDITSGDVSTLYEFLYRRPYSSIDPVAYEKEK